jgi:hypothetical protein
MDPAADKNEQLNTRSKVVLQNRDVMTLPENTVAFIHVYSLRYSFLLREDEVEHRKTLSLSQRQKKATLVPLRFVGRRCMLPGNQKKGIKMTVDTAKKEDNKLCGVENWDELK